MKKTILAVALLFSLNSFGSTVILKDNTIGTKTFEISSVGFSNYGVTLNIQDGKVACTVREDFMKANNLSGFDLAKEMTDKAKNYVVECVLSGWTGWAAKRIYLQ